MNGAFYKVYIACMTKNPDGFLTKDYMLAKQGEGMACWDCHRNVPHGGMNSLSGTPGAESQTPLPPSPVPSWLRQMID